MYTKEQFAKMIDQSLVRPDATKSNILLMVEQAIERRFAAVIVLPCWVGTVATALEGTSIKVGAVVGFPFGGDTRAAKSYAIRNAVSNGANEIDAVFNISKFKSGDTEGVKRELTEMIEAVRQSNGGAVNQTSRRVQLKVTIETCYLSEDEIELASRMVRDAGADFVQTSTGTGPFGATVENVRLIRRSIGPDSLGIKASGGVRTLEAAITLLDAGANRIGTSSGVVLVDSYEPDDPDD